MCIIFIYPHRIPVSTTHLPLKRLSIAFSLCCQVPRRIAPLKTERQATKKKPHNTAEVQTYLRKMYKQRKAIDRMAGINYKVSNFAGHKPLRLVAQQA